MAARVRSHLTYANVMATVAVFLALGGGAYAALKLPKNSVTARQIRAGAVRSSEVKNFSLLRKDFKRGQLPAGPQGQAGANGKDGPPGPTFGFAGGDTPPALGQVHQTLATAATNLPSAGKLFVYGRLGPGETFSCTQPSCQLEFALYVDGRPVPGSKIEWNGTNSPTSTSLTDAGVLPDVAAGNHTLTFEVFTTDATSGLVMNSPGGTNALGGVGGVLLGG